MRRRAALAPLAIVLLASALPCFDGAARADASLGAALAASAPNELDRLLARTDSEEQSLKAELGYLGPKLDLVRRRMRARGRAYYRLIRAGLLPAGGGFDALVDHAAHVERARMALERDVASEGSLVRRAGEIDARLLKLRADRAPLEVQREAMSRARVALQETEERRSAFTRAFETSQRPDSVAIYGADLGPSAADGRSGFRALKGRLPFPIAGRAEVRRVNRAGAGGPGVELVAALGAPVRSVAAGRVAFADSYDDHGITVILDHGDHYYSVYSNLGAAEVRVGESVMSGGRIGVVGAGAGRGAALYFELRHNAATVDPSPWLGL
jgi:murein DD-endopeptidase MepM/ murein hydrolase activator NlpD